MNIMQMLVHLLKSVSDVSVKINMKGDEVDIADLWESECRMKLQGRTAEQFIKEWVHHGKH